MSGEAPTNDTYRDFPKDTPPILHLDSPADSKDYHTLRDMMVVFSRELRILYSAFQLDLDTLAQRMHGILKQGISKIRQVSQVGARVFNLKGSQARLKFIILVLGTTHTSNI